MRLAELTLLFVFYVSIISISMAIKPQQVWREVNAEEVMEIVEHLAVERIVDTEGHRQVEAYIQNYFATHAPHWTFERDTFSDSTPLGEKTFVNLIATLDARPGELSDKYVVLAAHYDSKIIANTVFEAATDSAVPCAILMHFARHYTAMADSQLLASSQLGHNWGIKLIFFDGEEAFHEWTPVDSIYGSRHLAQEWENDNEKTLLARIDAFILLDLLGAPNMAPIPSRYTATNSKFQFFVNAQTASQQVGRLSPSRKYFSSEPQPYMTVEDDHIPWLRRGVPVVHLIPAPFPVVWHTEQDSIANLDQSAVRHLTALIELGVLSYLEAN